jgi:hypothetical protein
MPVENDSPGGQASNAAAGEPAEPPAEDVATDLAMVTEAGDSGAQAAEQTSGPVVAQESFAAHLSSVRSRDGTEAEWQSLVHQFPELLGRATLTVRAIEIDDKGTFYRVMAGTFDTFDQAQGLCDQFQANDQYCVVRHLDADSKQ